MRRLRLTCLVFLVLSALVLRLRDTRVVYGPILQRLEPDSALVLMYPEPGEDLHLRFRQPGGSWRRAGVEKRRKGRLFLFTLKPLEASRRWEYEVRTRSGALRGGGLFLSPPTAGAGRIRFAAFGDSGRIPWWSHMGDLTGLDVAEALKPGLPGRGGQWKIARQVSRMHPDLVLHLGDLVYPKGRWEDFPEAFFLPFGELLANVPIYPAMGNHDLLTEGGRPWLDCFEMPGKEGESEGRYYSFVRGPVRFICLDTFSPETPLVPGRAQWVWLRGVLKDTEMTWKVVYQHRPLWTASRSRPDPENSRLRRELHPLLAAHGVNLVLSGHDHVYQRFEPVDGVHYVVAGAGGKSLYKVGKEPGLVVWNNREFSFALIEADPNRLLLRALSTTGKELDRLEIVRN